MTRSPGDAMTCSKGEVGSPAAAVGAYGAEEQIKVRAAAAEVSVEKRSSAAQIEGEGFTTAPQHSRNSEVTHRSSWQETGFCF